MLSGLFVNTVHKGHYACRVAVQGHFVVSLITG